MIEVYLFLAVFLVQILGMSVLYPYQLSRVIRASLQKVSAERLAEIYPEVDVGGAHERFLASYRIVNTIVAVLGLLLLGWFFSYMERPDWDQGSVGGKLTAYFFLQNFPTVLLAWFTTRFNKVHRRSSPESKRKAVLQRRGLFDFVAPSTVVFAVLSYALFAAFMFYVARHPFPGFGGPFLNIGILTLGYVLLGYTVYRAVYGRKANPLQTHADRMHSTSVFVNTVVWTCVLIPITGALTIARQLLDLDTWGPFVGTAGFLMLGLLSLRMVSTLPRQPEPEGLGSGSVHQ